jgi:hypothetical protein
MPFRRGVARGTRPLQFLIVILFLIAAIYRKPLHLGHSIKITIKSMIKNKRFALAENTYFECDATFLIRACKQSP